MWFTDAMAAAIKRAIAIGSGKGGVGKSTVTLNLALALKESGASVGILDADVYAPDIPLMVNLTRRRPAESWTFWSAKKADPIEPVERFGLPIMSTGFLIAEDQALAWDSNLVQFLVWQLVNGVAWGDLDYLLIDLPPGTADLQQMFVKQLPIEGAVIVVTPQDIAHLDAKKTIAMFEDGKVPVLGAIENMSGFVCPHCREEVDIFSKVPDARSIWEDGVQLLGRLPFNPALSFAADRGRPLMDSEPESPIAEEFRKVARKISQILET